MSMQRAESRDASPSPPHPIGLGRPFSYMGTPAKRAGHSAVDTTDPAREHVRAMQTDFHARLRILGIDPRAVAQFDGKVDDLSGSDARALALDLMQMIVGCIDATGDAPLPSQSMSPLQCSSVAADGTKLDCSSMSAIPFVTTSSNTGMVERENNGLVFRMKRTNSIDSCASHVGFRKNSVQNTMSCERGVDPEGFKIINDYTVLQHLGQGASGKVKLAVHHVTNEVRAIKIVRRSMIKKLQGLNGLDRLKMEIAIMKKLKHRCIVVLYEVIDDPASDKVYFVMQHIEHGPLMKEPDDAGCAEPLPRAKVQLYLRQIISALIYLHNHGVAHLDIKPQNLLLGAEDHVYLVDFGISELMMDNDSNNVRCTGMGTPAYMAPEVCRGDEIVDGEAVDTWCLGVTAFFMIFGRLPFQGATVKELHEATLSSRDVPFPDMATDDERSFILALLQKDPAKRSKLRDLRSHEFLQHLSDSCMDSPRASDGGRRQSMSALLAENDIANALTSLTYSNSVSSQSSQASRSARQSLSFQASPSSTPVELPPVAPAPLPPLEPTQRVRNPREGGQVRLQSDVDGGIGDRSFSTLRTELTASFVDVAPDPVRLRRTTAAPV
jgi:[calcium/calmodulin-dependent protein kinase] kinase